MTTTYNHEMTDRQVEDAIFYAEVRITEHQEIDCEYGGEERCPRCEADRETIEAMGRERDYRLATGHAVEHDGPTFEERYEPFGIEWQIEQNERAVEGWR